MEKPYPTTSVDRNKGNPRYFTFLFYLRHPRWSRHSGGPLAKFKKEKNTKQGRVTPVSTHKCRGIGFYCPGGLAALRWPPRHLPLDPSPPPSLFFYHEGGRSPKGLNGSSKASTALRWPPLPSPSALFPSLPLPPSPSLFSSLVLPLPHVHFYVDSGPIWGCTNPYRRPASTSSSFGSMNLEIRSLCQELCQWLQGAFMFGICLTWAWPKSLGMIPYYNLAEELWDTLGKMHLFSTEFYVSMRSRQS